MIKLNLCLTDINKDRIRVGKNGKKYLDVIVMDSRNDKYGNDYMVVEDIPKADRDAGKKGNIIGNGKNLGSKKNSEQSNVNSGDLPY